jgi:hypothetical protein
MDELLERAINQLNNAAASYLSWGEQEKARELQELAEQIWINFGARTAERAESQRTAAQTVQPAECDPETVAASY